MFDFFCSLSLRRHRVRLPIVYTKEPSRILHGRMRDGDVDGAKSHQQRGPTASSRVREFTFRIFLSFRFAFTPLLMPDFFYFVLRNFNLVFIFGELITSFLPPSTACAFWCFVESCLFLDWDSADDCKIIKKMNVCWLRQQQLDEDGDEEHMEIGSEEGRKITESSEHLKIELT